MLGPSCRDLKDCELLEKFATAILNLLTGSAFAATEAHYLANDGKLILPDAYAPWCATRNNTNSAHGDSDFRIISPPPNAQYQIILSCQRPQQMVELTPAFASDVEWFVNGARAAPEHDGRCDQC